MLLGHNAAVNLGLLNMIHDLANASTTVSSVWFLRLFLLFSI